jgi:hypothetical protein
MVSTCERSINVVRRNKQKAQITGLSQKGNGVGTKAIDTLVMGKRKIKPTLPAKRADLTCQVTQEERGKPVTPPHQGQANRKENCWDGGQGIAEEAKAVL